MPGTMPRTPPGVQYFGHLGEFAAHRSTMSFILDALKKSEHSRLRQDHPAIFDAQAAAVRRQGLPRWGIALIALLALNLLILAYALWRPSESPQGVTAAPAEVASPSPLGAATADTPSVSGPSPSGSSPTAPQPTRPTRAVTSPASVVPRGAPQPPLVRVAPAAALGDETPTLPSRDDLLAAGAAIPEANLNMHVYDANPTMRFVLLNGQRLREGEVSREGLRVEQILPEGVLLNAGGNSFMLSIN